MKQMNGEELCYYKPALMLLKLGWPWGSTGTSKLGWDISESLHLPVHTHYSHYGMTGKLVAGIQGCDDPAERPPKHPLSSGPLVNNKWHSNDVDQISHSQATDKNIRNHFFPGPKRHGGKAEDWHWGSTPSVYAICWQIFQLLKLSLKVKRKTPHMHIWMLCLVYIQAF